jgi:hypothetical protein
MWATGHLAFTAGCGKRCHIVTVSMSFAFSQCGQKRKCLFNQPSYFQPIGSTSTIHCQNSSTYVTSVARDTEYSSTQPVRISAFTV